MRPCTVCCHLEREAIEAKLLAGSLSLRTVAGQHGLDHRAVHRHRINHLPQQPTIGDIVELSAFNPWLEYTEWRIWTGENWDFISTSKPPNLVACRHRYRGEPVYHFRKTAPMIGDVMELRFRSWPSWYPSGWYRWTGAAVELISRSMPHGLVKVPLLKFKDRPIYRFPDPGADLPRPYYPSGGCTIWYANLCPPELAPRGAV